MAKSDTSRFDLKIDGRSWDYRDPDNYAKIQRDERGDDNPRGFNNTGSGNQDSYEFTNPLYDYSYGQARDAAKELGISNVNKEDEVAQILDYLKNPPVAEAPKKPKDKKKPKNKKPNFFDVEDPEREEVVQNLENLAYEFRYGDSTDNEFQEYSDGQRYDARKNDDNDDMYDSSKDDEVQNFINKKKIEVMNSMFS